MKKKRVLFRLDANQMIGYGHLMRCIAIASELKRNANIEVIFASKDILDIEFKTIKIRTKPKSDIEDEYIYEKINNEIDEFIEIIKNNHIDILIIDHYGVNKEYIVSLRPYIEKIVLIDDNDIDRAHSPIDMLINGNCYAEKLTYNDVGKILLLGSKYTLLRKEFLGVRKKIINQRATKLTISSGGSDPLRFSLKAIKAIKLFPEKIKPEFIFIIIGAGYTKDVKEQIKKEIANDDRFVMLENCIMSKIMLESDLFINSSGSILNELAYVGVPSVSVILSEDQVQVAKYMNAIGTTYNIGQFKELTTKRFSDAIQKVIIDIAERKKMHENSINLIDGLGVRRVANELMKIGGL